MIEESCETCSHNNCCNSDKLKRHIEKRNIIEQQNIKKMKEENKDKNLFRFFLSVAILSIIYISYYNY